MNIAVLGTGYVGLVAGVCFADAGHDVTCVDSNEKKIQTLISGKVPFFEPGLDELFHMNMKRMSFTTSIAEAVKKSTVIFIAVGTPELPDGSADMDPTFGVLAEICQAANEPKVVVLKSTVPIGTSRKVESFIQENCKFKIDVINNPEFLRQGAAIEDFLRPDRVVIGCESERGRQLMQELYEPFVTRNGTKPILFMDNTSAEMTKYAANSFLALKISFINELALLSDKLGADIDSVRAGFTSDSRINPAFFNPGIGYGGSCFPKDVRALIHAGKQFDLDLKLLKAADSVNERQKTILTERLISHVGSLKGKTVAIWGLAFKPRTDDVRRAPSLKIMEELFLNGAKVRAFDPVATRNAVEACRVPFEACDSPMEAIDGADALLIVTEWPEFRALNGPMIKAKMKVPLVFDGRNLYDPAKMKEAGIEYYGIGRQVRSRG
ncbi:MAG: UDP-glucose/GDP-mannose dehydrogenase family protein [Bdellovibrionaceae bacterium]|nr:UDP-glucose/GDP-mannose dehydrogenase family protein [Pseudobdellovibrionaceae bacterium]